MNHRIALRLLSAFAVFATVLAAVSSTALAAGRKAQTGRIRDHVLVVVKTDLLGKSVTGEQLDKIADTLESAYGFYTDPKHLGFLEPDGKLFRGRMVARLEEFAPGDRWMAGYAGHDGVMHLGVHAIASMEDVAPHELFHMIQRAYIGIEQPWIQESTAEWATEAFLSGPAFGYQHERAFLFNPDVSLHYHERDARGLLQSGRGRPYGTSIFFRFLAAQHPRGVNIVRDMFEKTGDLELLFEEGMPASLKALIAAVKSAPTESKPLRPWLERFAAACILGAEAPPGLDLPNIGRMAATGGKVQAYHVDLTSDFKRHLTQDFKLRSEAPWTSDPYPVCGLGTRYFRVDPPPDIPTDIPLVVSVPAQRDDVGLLAFQHDGTSWTVRRGVHDATAGEVRVSLPYFTYRPREAFLALIRYSAELTPRDCRLTLCLADPPVVDEVIVSQGGKAILQVRWDEIRDDTGLLTGRTKKDIVSGRLDPAGGDLHVAIAFSRPMQALEDQPLCQVGSAPVPMTPSQGNRLWVGDLPTADFPAPGTSTDLWVNGYSDQKGTVASLVLDEDPATVAAVEAKSWTRYEVTSPGMRIPLSGMPGPVNPAPAIKSVSLHGGRLGVIDVETAALATLDSSGGGRFLALTWRIEELGGLALASGECVCYAAPGIGKSLEEDPTVDRFQVSDGRRVAEDRMLLFADAAEQPILPSRPDAPLLVGVRQEWRGSDGKPIGEPVEASPVAPAAPVVRFATRKAPGSGEEEIALDTSGDFTTVHAALVQPDLPRAYPGAAVTVTSGPWTGHFYAPFGHLVHGPPYGVPPQEEDPDVRRNLWYGSYAHVRVPADPAGGEVRVTFRTGSVSAGAILTLPPDRSALERRQSWLAEYATPDKHPLRSQACLDRKRWIEEAPKQIEELEARRPAALAAVEAADKAPVEAGKEEKHLDRLASALSTLYYVDSELLKFRGKLAFESAVATANEVDQSDTVVARMKGDWAGLVAVLRRHADRMDPGGRQAREEAEWGKKELDLAASAGRRIPDDHPGRFLLPDGQSLGWLQKAIDEIPLRYTRVRAGALLNIVTIAPLAGDPDALMGAYRELLALRDRFGPDVLVTYLPSASAVADDWVMLGGDRREAADLWLAALNEEIASLPPEQQERERAQRLRLQNLPAWWPPAEGR